MSRSDLVLQVQPAQRQHALEIGADPRPADALEVQRASGKTVEQALLEALEQPDPVWVVLENGSALAMFGCARAGTTLDPRGVPWLLGRPGMDRHRRVLITLSRGFIRYWIGQFGTLVNAVDVENEPAIRLLRALGFTLDPPLPWGIAGAPFHRFWRTA